MAKFLSAVFISVLSLFLFPNSSFAQGGVGINTNTPDGSAQLDITSTTKGMLVPRMTTVQRVAISSPATGLLVYDTDLSAFYYYSGTAWTSISGGGTGPTGATGATGTAGTTGATGATGATGTAGTAGTNGTNGATGATGATGTAGTNGTNGATGATGATGTNGTNGATGATGTAGTNGTNGATGATGTAGTAGTNGTNGSNGAAGATGPTGTAGTNGTNGSNGSAGATGPTGATGTGFGTGVTGSTPYYNGTTWIMNSTNIYNNAGNVGIGTTISTPTAQLEVGSTGTTNSNNVADITNTSTGGFAGLWFKDGTGNPYIGYIGTANSGSTTSWVGNASSMQIATTSGAPITFLTGTSGSTTGSASTGVTLTERMRITPTGAVAFGGATNTGTAGQFLVSGGSTVSPAWGALGQAATTVFGTSALSVTSSTTFTLIPGLTQTVTVPANSVVYLSTDGGINTTSASASGFSIVDIAFVIDGSIPTNGGYRRVTALNNGGIGSTFGQWAITGVFALSAGSHTIKVESAYSQGSTCSVSSDNTSVKQGQLTVMILKQ